MPVPVVLVAVCSFQGEQVVILENDPLLLLTYGPANELGILLQPFALVFILQVLRFLDRSRLASELLFRHSWR